MSLRLGKEIQAVPRKTRLRSELSEPGVALRRNYPSDMPDNASGFRSLD
ncbi:MAG: hypothetical protein ACI9BW_001317 [Gammaproteobacteria bacterium]|jgi:hypothetical protein